MPHTAIASIARVVQTFFYTFLDISGIMLGAFLIFLGWWVVAGRHVPNWLGLLVLVLGIAAFMIHLGHYFHLRLTGWIFGSETYFHKDERTHD